MSNQKDSLWPYNKSLALLAIPAVWLFFFILFAIAKFYGLPEDSIRSEFIVGFLILSLVPLLMVLIDFFSSRGAVLDVKGFKVDFSSINLNRPEIKKESFGLPDNIGISGPIISDTSPMNIVHALQEASAYEIAVVDIKDGEAWWVTRLLALSAGALRAGSPHVLVFIGKKNNNSDHFLGCGKPKDILEAILNNKEKYRNRYDRAIQIAGQVKLFNDNDLLPHGITLSQEIIRYRSSDEYMQLGDAMTEQIIMDQLANAIPPDGSMEKPPDKLTLHRVEELFRPCLYEEAIDLSSTNEQQINQLLSSKASYVALIRDSRFQSMVRQDDVEKLVLKELFLQFQNGNNK